ncbi:MAG TPA: zinc-dependent alcohol dehydrogenase family protein [Terriglobia bacterium]|nr:zinc-dependent alcohol dehydrogenase family protein [Terriglobia bacterium]
MDTARTVRFGRLGGPEVLQIEDLPIVEPKSGEVRIRVQAIGLNRAEIMFRTGQYLEQPEFPSRIGLEATGIVEAIGAGVTKVRIGDKVSVATGQSIAKYGTYGETAIVPASSAISYPDNLTPEEAASVWVQYLTAYFAFVDLAKIQPGQSVLITAATGGAGLGAIEVARLLGGVAIATTRSTSKQQALLDSGADHVIVTSKEDLGSRVKEITGGRGADLIFDPIAGDTLPTLAEAVAWGGQIILYGALGGTNVPYPLFAAFARNFTLRSYVVYSFCGLETLGLRRNEEAFARAVRFINENLASGKLQPLIAKIFPLSEIQEAHRYMESNQQLGKIVIKV